ncbi:MAG: hypothetical protein ACR2RV_17825, partial [Verrucomicrobiales bacterium]
MRASLSSIALLALGAGIASLTPVPLAADEMGAARLRIHDDTSQISLTLSAGDSGQVHYLEASQDLVSWREIAFSNVTFERYSLPKQVPARYFRSRSREADEASDWTNQLMVSDQRIFAGSGAGDNPTFAKFTVEIDNPERVYFQNSERYPFHFQFARARLPGYDGIGIQEYERISLFRDGQELLLGTVLLPPDPSITEFAIQFTGGEAFAIEDIANWFEVVRNRILAPDGWRCFYLPSFEQSQAAFDNYEWFAERGIHVDTASRWITDNTC